MSREAVARVMNLRHWTASVNGPQHTCKCIDCIAIKQVSALAREALSRKESSVVGNTTKTMEQTWEAAAASDARMMKEDGLEPTPMHPKAILSLEVGTLPESHPCKVKGHAWDNLLTYGSPHTLRCQRCGELGP